MIPRLGKTFVILLFVIILFSGCSIMGGKTQEYYSSAKEFNNIYFEVVEQIDGKNPMRSLESLQSEEKRNRIERLGVLLDTIKQTVPQYRETHYYAFKERYDDLVFLRDSYAKFDKLSIEERGRIDRAIILIGVNKVDWKNKKSKTVWE